MTKLPALSIRQPWAWLIANGQKDIENRRWATAFRGRVLIHAAKAYGDAEQADLEIVRADFPHFTYPERFDLGGIVGIATITGCVRLSVSPWFCGPFGFTLEDARVLPFTPCKGALGFFKPDLTPEQWEALGVA